MEVFVYYPKANKDMKELEKRVAMVHAQAVIQYIQRMSCPQKQKLQLINALKKKGLL